MTRTTVRLPDELLAAAKPHARATGRSFTDLLADSLRFELQGATATRRFIDELLQFVDIAPTTTVHLRAASTLAFKDFEDVMQVGAALACAAECTATRNARDFRRSPIPALTPANVIARLA